MIEELLRNAQLHAWKGDELLITVNIHQTWQHCHIQIQDNGAGFDLGCIENFLQPVTTMRERDTLRLGIALAWRCARWNNGSLHIASAPGAGTRIDITLPRR